LQDTQAPVHAVLQQTPSTQKPLTHSSFARQTAPGEWGEQEPFTHEPVAQSSFVSQSGQHVFVCGSHEYGSQTSVGPGLQVPTPSQTRTPTTVLPSQRPASHWVPGGCRRHAPVPSHVPSSPQVDWSWGTQSPGSRGPLPAGRAMQKPAAPGAAHVRHPLAHAVEQQTLSTQNPLRHAPANMQGAPSGARSLKGAAPPAPAEPALAPAAPLAPPAFAPAVPLAPPTPAPAVPFAPPAPAVPVTSSMARTSPRVSGLRPQPKATTTTAAMTTPTILETSFFSGGISLPER
jgi:hypothetical protein